MQPKDLFEALSFESDEYILLLWVVCSALFVGMRIIDSILFAFIHIRYSRYGSTSIRNLLITNCNEAQFSFPEAKQIWPPSRGFRLVRVRYGR